MKTPPCFDNHHAGSTHEHAALTRARDEAVFFAVHASARPATWCNRVSWVVWLLTVLSFASPIECRSMVVSYLLFRCVLVTFVGGVSSSAYASLDDGMAHYDTTTGLAYDTH